VVALHYSHIYLIVRGTPAYPAAGRYDPEDAENMYCISTHILFVEGKNGKKLFQLC
jgi:hypothetical protein